MGARFVEDGHRLGGVGQCSPHSVTVSGRPVGPATSSGVGSAVCRTAWVEGVAWRRDCGEVLRQVLDRLQVGAGHVDFRAVVADSLARQGLMAHLGAELTGVEPGQVQIELGFRGSSVNSKGSSRCGHQRHHRVGVRLLRLTLTPVGSKCLLCSSRSTSLPPGRPGA